MSNVQKVSLQSIRADKGREYFCNYNKRNCIIVGAHQDDGACLIAEALDADNDITHEIFYTESGFLEPLPVSA